MCVKLVELMDICGYDIDDKVVCVMWCNLQEVGFGGIVMVDYGDVLEIQLFID